MERTAIQTIGKIIKSNSHADYVCQVYGPGETHAIPSPEERALGTWVELPVGSDAEARAVGLVYDTQLYNPEYGAFGPRLSSPAQLEVFSPDYLNETAVLLGVLVVGQMRGDTLLHSGYCPLAAEVGAPVSTMHPERVRAFHDGGGALALGYYGAVLSYPAALAPALMRRVLIALGGLLPEHAPALRALDRDLSWRMHVAELAC